jgi:hypothetical protein
MPNEVADSKLTGFAIKLIEVIEDLHRVSLNEASIVGSKAKWTDGVVRHPLATLRAIYPLGGHYFRDTYFILDILWIVLGSQADIPEVAPRIGPPDTSDGVAALGSI